MSKILRALLAVVLVLVLIAVIAFWTMGRRGENQIEAWIGTQIKQIVNSRINPVLSFDSLDYQSPNIVIVKNLRVTADSAVGRVDILSASEATIQLAEIPREGKPIVIQEIRLRRPTIRVIADGDDPTRFVGFSGFVKRQGAFDPKSPDESGRTLSDVLRIRFIELADGEIEYDPKIDDTQSMVLRDINARLNVNPASAGLYQIKTELHRAPIFSLTVDGKFDIDRARFVETRIVLDAKVNQSALSSLPPQLQKIINQYEIRGGLRIDGIGGLELRDPLDAWLRSDVTLQDANVTIGDWCVPIQAANFKLAFDNRLMTFTEGEMTAFDGLTRFNGEIAVNSAVDVKLSVDARRINLAKFMSSRATTQPTSLRGIVDAQFQMSAPSKILAAKIMTGVKSDNPRADDPLPENWGSGRLELRDGRLVRFPFITRFNDAVARLAKLVRLDNSSTDANESASAQFTMKHDQLHFSKLDYSGDLIAARGTGSIGLNQSLDLRFNAGPIEKLQSKLGVVGDLFGAITDNLGSYRVTGTIEDPQINMELFR